MVSQTLKTHTWDKMIKLKLGFVILENRSRAGYILKICNRSIPHSLANFWLSSLLQQPMSRKRQKTGHTQWNHRWGVRRAGRCVTGTPTDHLIGSKWNDWLCLLQSYEGQTPAFILFLQSTFFIEVYQDMTRISTNHINSVSEITYKPNL